MSSVLAHATALHRRFGLAARRRRMPRSRPPTAIELEYGKSLLAVVTRSRATVQPLLAELPRLLEQQDGVRVHQLIQAARARAAMPALDRAELSSRFGGRVADYARAQFARQVKAKLGVDLASLIPRLQSTVRHDAANPVDAFVHENVALIESLGDTPLTEVGMMITRAFGSGTHPTTLAKEIGERFSVADSRARLIARDQIGKLNGQVSAQAHKQLGVRRFTWRTVGDERVRDEHAALDGQVFSYDDLPAEGLPGTPIQCRCSDEPVLDDILDDLDAIEGGQPQATVEPPDAVEPARERPALERALEHATALPKISTAVRGELDRQGLHKREHADDRVTVDARRIPPGAHAVREWDGEVIIRPEARDSIEAFTALFRADPATARSELAGMTVTELHKSAVVNDMTTLVHEQIHGYGPGHVGNYHGSGVIIEEVTTETLARRTMRESFGADWRGTGSVEGSYHEEITKVLDVVRAANPTLTHEGAWDALERASHAYKSEKPAGPYATERMRDIQARFVDHLTTAAQPAHGTVDEARARAGKAFHERFGTTAF